jgi:hypothetical protein
MMPRNLLKVVLDEDLINVASVVWCSDPVAAGIAALQDQVDCWCYGIKSAVKLNDPEILRLIQAATS